MFEIEYTKAARKDLRKLDHEPRERIAAAVENLSSDPHPSGSRKMIGAEALFRIRVGDYRVIYEVRNDVLTIFIIKVGHRKDIYRKK